ncbi:hypothetical protein HU200_034495 [Digitaria exilis]|uniref:Uncharacterized protein n=1 Tax=Digitaria exilis TaxID=1010633 RepID=A0A835EMI8_9POAL|nr:hypothetical protein HU200_034495 [Digitaria exilis]
MEGGIYLSGPISRVRSLHRLPYEASQRWSVTSVPLLRWQSKLKHAAQECDHTLRRCRRRVQEEEEERSSLPSRVARFAMSFVTSILGGVSDDELEGSAVRRFERFADGASEFLRGQHLSFILQPFIPPGHGMEAALLLLLEDDNYPENNFLLTLSLRLSESTDIVGSVVRCLELFTPYLRSTAEAAKKKLTQLPTQDLLWVPDARFVYGHDEPEDNLDIIFAKQSRPNPLCCQQVYQSDSMQRHAPSGSSTTEPMVSDIYLEPVTQVYLLGHVTLPDGNKRQQNGIINGKAGDSPYLKLGWNFWPHASS